MEPRDAIARMIPVRSVGAHQMRVRFTRGCWPGESDRHLPAASEWLRRWYPRDPAVAAMTPVCGCAAGRCAVCN